MSAAAGAPAAAGAGPGAPAGAGARIGRNILHLLLGQATTTAIAIAYSAALGRTLGPKDFGVFFLVTTMAAFSFVVVEWGGGLFVIREIARAPDRAGLLLGSALALRAGGAVAIVLPTVVVAWLLGYEPRILGLAAAAVAAALPLSLAQAHGMVFRGRDRMDLDAGVTVLNKAAAFALAVPALWLGLGVGGVLGAQAAAGVAAVLLAAGLYRRMGAPPLSATRAGAREVVAGSLPLLALAVANSVQPYLDAVVLSKLATGQAVGWFGAARNIAGTLLAPAGIIAAATYPHLSRAADSPAQLRPAMRLTLRPVLWLGALGAVGTWRFADVAVGLIYGRQGFGPSAEVLAAYAPGLFLTYVDVQLGHAAVATGRANRFVVLKAFTIAAGTALALWLVPHFEATRGNGGLGIAAAYGGSELLVFLGAVTLLPRGALELALAADLARAVAAGAATFGLFLALPPLPPYVGIPLCVTAFSAASLAVGLVRREDAASLRDRALRRLRGGRNR
ncbi:MAG: oligosaccharide flippase family protein [Anaeromyxobacter sp.]